MSNNAKFKIENYGKVPEPECKDGEEHLYMCPPNGPSIVLRRCINGKWVDVDEQCPGRGCHDEHVITEKCENGHEIVVKKCIDGKWINTGNKCGKGYKCFYWLLDFKFKTWLLCIFGKRPKKYKDGTIERR